VLDTNDLPTPPCVKQARFESVGELSELTDYLHVREQP
jgi:hypothetical protein